MNSKKKVYVANKIVWVERWVLHYLGEHSEWEGIIADKLPNGKWESTLKLPMVDEIVTVTSNTEVGAMLKMGEVQTKILKEYLEEHKEVKFSPLSSVRNWEIVSDEEGNFKSIGLTSKARRKNGEALIKIEEECVKVIEKAIQRINKITGSKGGIVIHVYDKDLLPNRLSEREYIDKEAKKVYEEIDDSYIGVTIRARDQYVISIGYGEIKNGRSDA